MTRDERKAQYRAYREVAKKLTSETHYLPVTVSETANVQVTEEGAFVEAMIWVPKEALDVDIR